MLKKMPNSQLRREINELLYDLKLTDDKGKYVQDLSDQAKRKLSLAISLVGGSKVVFLDEPSSTMDIDSRKEMWDILQKYK